MLTPWNMVFRSLREFPCTRGWGFTDGYVAKGIIGHGRGNIGEGSEIDYRLDKH